jgi:hypothetical protein
LNCQAIPVYWMVHTGFGRCCVEPTQNVLEASVLGEHLTAYTVTACLSGYGEH